MVIALLVSGCDTGTDGLPLTPLQLAEPCDVEAGCVASAAEFGLRLSMGPDIRVLTPFPLSIEVQGDQAVEAVTVAFDMQGMDMGVNRYQLISDGARRWLANVTLPVCGSGRSDWIAAVELSTSQRRYVVEVPFVVGK
jgi:hypothetical protein